MAINGMSLYKCLIACIYIYVSFYFIVMDQTYVPWSNRLYVATKSWCIPWASLWQWHTHGWKLTNALNHLQYEEHE